MISIDNRSRIPLYEQLMENIKMHIIKGVMKPDEQLPSVRQLAQELTINPNTIQKAYRELEREGFTYSIPGRGSFVQPIENDNNKERVDELTTELEKIIEELLFLGLTKEEIQQKIETITGGK
ncbi:GntR family transcriptional regulator [Macrococcus hajekii]|uniref:GntR family transcriptional regulator n=1 Tax=Macrococcus hajekii TaxID=198482 RepID=A0A4R6BIY8_9STAP|nr:GntR family transcriptional regulator [Macrococcus hajekii]TDM01567.1 GntR family transcriptional regulator [Macrococcus hajekii]GGB01068.1 GntR family transcriptional regulator [Macrococcus hajekii]